MLQLHSRVLSVYLHCYAIKRVGQDNAEEWEEVEKTIANETWRAIACITSLTVIQEQ